MGASTCLASTMSFLRIALFSILAVPALSSINPILRAIDSNNKDGPHFRSFLFPNSYRAVNARLATPSLPSFVSLNAVATSGIQNLPVISKIQNIARPAQSPLTNFNSAATRGIKNVPTLTKALTEASLAGLNAATTGGIQNGPVLTGVISNRQNIPRPAKIPFTSFNSAATFGMKKVPALTGSLTETSFRSLNTVATGGNKKVPLELDDEVSSNVQIPTVKSFTSLNEPHQLVASAHIEETPLLSEIMSTRTSVQRPSTPLTGNNQKNEYLENLQLNGNSLEDFKVELHPEEELVRSG